MITLENSKLFRDLPAAEHKFLGTGTRELTFQPGQEVFKEGDPGDGIYVVKAGGVQISGVVGTGERRVFSRVQPGDFFGEMSVLDNQPRSATATAAGETTLYFLPRQIVVELLTRSPDLCMTVLQEISRRLREFNQQYIREVLQAERLSVVGRFASSIVHDLKNPLGIISMAAELAGMEGASANSRQHAQDRITKQVDRITALVNDILEFTRGDTHTIMLAPEDYGDFAKSIVAELHADIAHKPVTLDFDGPVPSARAMLNPPRLGRVFYNLVHNAVDAMPDGGGIRVSVRLAENDIETEVADTGKGIAPEVIERLFEPFATFGKAKGTGLGLSICKRIIEEHRGRVWARNHEEGGAVFGFAIPRLKD